MIDSEETVDMLRFVAEVGDERGTVSFRLSALPQCKGLQPRVALPRRTSSELVLA